MKGRRIHIALSLFTALATGALTAGCENSVEPFADTTRHFAIYGFLDADADTQFVRVEATRPNLDNDADAGSDISNVTTQNMGSGETVSWTDSAIVLDDGSPGLLYWAVFRPIPRDPYQIEVVRSDGATSSATTTVPAIRSVDPLDPTRTFSGTIEQALIMENVARRPEAITVNYDIGFPDGREPLRITLDYNVFGVPVPGGWKIDVRLTRDRERINGRLGLPPTAVLHLHEISMTMRLLSADWPLVGSREIVNNVTDGFGYFGAAATHGVNWQVDSVIVRELGFEDLQRRTVSGG